MKHTICAGSDVVDVFQRENPNRSVRIDSSDRVDESRYSSSDQSFGASLHQSAREEPRIEEGSQQRFETRTVGRATEGFQRGGK